MACMPVGHRSPDNAPQKAEIQVNVKGYAHSFSLAKPGTTKVMAPSALAIPRIIRICCDIPGSKITALVLGPVVYSAVRS